MDLKGTVRKTREAGSRNLQIFREQIQEVDERYVDALRIFFFLLIVFTVFAHTVGDNELSRFDTTLALVENGSLSLSGLHANTGDKALIDGEYYPTKPPLPSLLATPSYILVDRFFGGGIDVSFYLERFRRSFDPKMAWGLFAATVSVSAVAGALTASLLFLIARELELGRKRSLLVGLLSGLGTLVFPYSTTFHGTMLGTMFLVSAVFLWIKEYHRQDTSTVSLLSFLVGLGVSSSYTIIIPGGILLALVALPETEGSYLQSIANRKKSIAALGTGLLAGLLPLLLFHFSITGNPLEPPMLYSTYPEGAAGIQDTSTRAGGHLLQLDTGMAGARALRALFSPLSGLFLYSPLLLLGVAGLKKTYSTDRKVFWFTAGSFLSSLLLFSFVPYWLSRAYYGPRYLLASSVLLIIPLMYQLKSLEDPGRYLGYALGGLSVLFMAASTQPWQGYTWRRAIVMLEQMRTHGIAENRLGEYLSLMPSNGLQSPLISYLSGASSELHMVLSSYPEYVFYLGGIGDRVALFDTRAALAIIMLLAGFLLFRSQVTVSRFYTGRRFVALLGLIAFIGLSSTTGVYMDGWYDKKPDENVQWGREEPELIFSARSSGAYLVSFQIRAAEERDVELKLGDRTLMSRRIGTGKQSFTDVLELQEGVNRLRFETGRCTVMGRANDNRDARCVTVGTSNLSFSSTAVWEKYLGKNIEREDGSYYLSGNSTLFISERGRHSIDIEGRAIGNETVLEVYQDGEKISESRVGTFGSDFSTPYFEVNGTAEITLVTNCEDRCSRIRLSDLEINSLKDVPESLLYRPGSNWYQKIGEERYRWSTGKNTTLHIYNHQNQTTKKSLWIEGRSFGQEKTYQFTLNGKQIGERLMPTTAYQESLTENRRKRNVVGFNVELKPGYNQLKISSDTGCLSVGRINDNDDVRCANFGLEQLYLDQPLQGARKSLNLGDKFEIRDGDYVIDRNASVYVSGHGSYSLAIDGRSTAQGELRVYNGEKLVGETSIDRYPFNYTTPFKSIDGLEQLSLVPVCSPSDCELIIQELDIQLLREKPDTDLYDLGRNWYKKKPNEKYRWSTGKNTTLHIYNHQNQTTKKSLWIEGRSFGQEKTYSFWHESRKLGERLIPTTAYQLQGIGEGRSRNVVSFNVNLKPGSNRIRISSDTGCIPVSEVNNNDDVRCANFGLEQLYLDQPLQGARKSLSLGNGFTSLDNRYRVNESAELYISAGGKYQIEIDGEAARRGRLEIWEDEELIGETSITRSPFRFTTPFKSIDGLQKLELETHCSGSCGLELTDIEIGIWKNKPDTDLYDLGRNWYKKKPNEKYRWSTGKNTTLHIYNHQNQTTKKSLWIEGRSFGQEKTYQFTLNGKQIGERLMPGDESLIFPEGRPRENAISFDVQLEPGENILKIGSNSNCREIEDDERCANFGLEQLYLDQPLQGARKSLSLGNGFGSVEGGYLLSGDGEIYARADSRYQLELDGRGYSEGDLEFWSGDTLISETGYDLYPFNFTTPVLESAGVQKLELENICPEKCNLKVSRIDIQTWDEKDESDLYDLGRNWYMKKPGKKYRWSSGNASIWLYNHRNSTVRRELWVAGRSFGVPRNVTYRLNGETVGSFEIGTKSWRPITLPNGTVVHGVNKRSMPVELESGTNRLEIESPTGCLSMGEVNNNDDVRCSMFGLERLYLTERTS